MSQDLFFKSISEHYSKKLPFVVYCKPSSFHVHALLQKNDVLFKISDYTESGFIFAPFDFRKDSILIPFGLSKSLKLSTEIIQADDRELKEYKAVNDKDRHIKIVHNAINAIRDGQLEKVVLSRFESLTLEKVELIEIIKRTILLYDAAFTYCWYHPQVGLWVGATPETLLTVENGIAHTMALAGSQEYQGVTDVLWNDKEKQEQEYVTNYIVKQLEPHVADLEINTPETVRAGQLLHLQSSISGVLKTKDTSLKQILTALHPTPAVCGLPKVDALQFILDNENYNREFYTGFLGELNYESKNDQYRSSDLYVNLRCMQLKEKEALVYVGGGITKQSDPENEWIETMNKSKTMVQVIAF